MHGRPATATSSAIQRVAPFARLWAHFSAEHFRFVMIVVLYPMRVPTRAREQPVLPSSANSSFSTMTAGASYRRLFRRRRRRRRPGWRPPRSKQNLCDLPEVPLHRPHQARRFVLVRSEDRPPRPPAAAPPSPDPPRSLDLLAKKVHPARALDGLLEVLGRLVGELHK